MTDVFTLEQVTPEFLTEILQKSGSSDTEVTRLEHNKIGTGQMGMCVRFNLSYSNASSALPKTLIGKFASEDPGSRALGGSTSSYVREVGFYQNMSFKLNIPIPKCYYAAIDSYGVNHLILLEDLSPAMQGDQITGCSPGLAKVAVDHLVNLHQPTWCSRSLHESKWLAREDPHGYQKLTQAVYNQLVPKFIERNSSMLSAEGQRVLERLGETTSFPVYHPSNPVFCLTHGDYRLDNFLIQQQTSPYLITVVDWENAAINQPMTDVAYCLGSCLSPTDRQEHERNIVKEYHNSLLRGGVKNFDWEDCWNEYRKGTSHALVVMVVASLLVETTERGERMFDVMVERITRHACDLNCLEFLN